MRLKKTINKILLAFLLLFTSCAQTTIQDEIAESTVKIEPVVEFYAASWCDWCYRAEEFLNKNNIKYVKYNFEDQDDYRRLVNAAKRVNYKKQLNSIPIFVIENKIIVGFNPIEIIYTLDRKTAITYTFTRNSSPIDENTINNF